MLSDKAIQALRPDPDRPCINSQTLVLFERFSDPRTADFARRQRDVSTRFGRFPHHNTALGRVSSAEELAFLKTPDSRLTNR